MATKKSLGERLAEAPKKLQVNVVGRRKELERAYQFILSAASQLRKSLDAQFLEDEGLCDACGDMDEAQKIINAALMSMGK